MARETEADRWRRQAHEALARLAKVMNFFAHAAASLIRLTEIHQADDFSHCACCGEPWPCATVQIVQKIARGWDTLLKEEQQKEDHDR